MLSTHMEPDFTGLSTFFLLLNEQERTLAITNTESKLPVLSCVILVFRSPSTSNFNTASLETTKDIGKV
jgi:hypothetical protein